MAFKKYEIKNYSEYIINVSIGKRSFSIPFTGGALTNVGSIPASYSTNNEIIQYAIEHSRYFAIGIVYLAQEIKTDEELKKLEQSSQPTPQLASSKRSSGEEKAIKKIKAKKIRRKTGFSNNSKKLIGSPNIGNYGEDICVAIIDTGIKQHLDFVVPNKSAARQCLPG